MGLSSEPLWWGLINRYPLNMNNNAPGVHHLFFNSRDPLEIPYVGEISFRWVLGYPQESDYYEGLNPGVTRFINALNLAYRQSFLGNLTIGATTVFHIYEVDGFNLDQVSVILGPIRKVSLIQSQGVDSDRQIRNRVISIYAHLRLPEAKAEIYGEFFREDHSFDFRDFSSSRNTKIYKQLDLQDRYQIKALLDAGHCQTKIVQMIGVHKSTISREFSRNIAKRCPTANTYRPDLAQKKTDQRHGNKPKHKSFTDLLKKQATEWLEQEKLSPELISGRWRVQGTDGVSHEAIYQWIWAAKNSSDPQYGHLYKELKHGRRKRKRGNYNDNRGILCNRVSIQQRPSTVEDRSRLGDLEIDLMMGKAHKSALLVITDRATLLTGIEKVTSRKADSMSREILNKLRHIPTSFIKTLERHINNRPIRKFDYLSPIQQTLKYRAVALII